MATTPDVKKFIEDPAFQGDRDLFDGYLEHALAKRAAEVKARAEKKEAPVSIFDALFGYKGPQSEEPESIFDVPFLGRRQK